MLDLLNHRARVEHSAGEVADIDVIGRPVAAVTDALIEAVDQVAGEVAIKTNPQETRWTVNLDVDQEHHHYDPDQVSAYSAAATQAALVLAEYRAPYEGRSTPVNAWWGSFDLSVSLFSGAPAEPGGDEFLSRNGLAAQEVAVGWWPGDPHFPQAAFYAYAHPEPDGFEHTRLGPSAARWHDDLGEFVLRWDDLRSSNDPHADAVAFARSAFNHAAAASDWAPDLAASLDRDPLQ